MLGDDGERPSVFTHRRPWFSLVCERARSRDVDIDPLNQLTNDVVGSVPPPTGFGAGSN
jgi:hypothetical protein